MNSERSENTILYDTTKPAAITIHSHQHLSEVVTRQDPKWFCIKLNLSVL